ncbi:MAG: preprotein translocase subunit SecG [Candidatus Cloacimonadota bacterium]|nr:preprotein translocase subunit SecG [Candidatus Cloacimonadota bacterium]
MYVILLVIHVIICISLIISVLLQSSKGGGLGGAFGGGGGNTLFGSEGASSFLKKATEVLGVSFMVVTILLALSSGNQRSTKVGGTLSEQVKQEIEKSPQDKTDQPAALPSGFEKLTEPEENKENK